MTESGTRRLLILTILLLLQACNKPTENPAVKAPENPTEKPATVSYATAVRCSVLAGRLGYFPALAKRTYEQPPNGQAGTGEFMIRQYRKYEYSFKGYALTMADKMGKTAVQVETDLADSSGLTPVATDDPTQMEELRKYQEWRREWQGVCQEAVKSVP